MHAFERGYITKVVGEDITEMRESRTQDNSSLKASDTIPCNGPGHVNGARREQILS